MSTRPPTDAELVAEWERRGPEDPTRFVPWVTPQYIRPIHLRPIAKLFQRCLTEQVRAVCSAPPRHTKTDFLLHGVSWLLLRRPWMPVGYVSYAERFAARKCRRGRRIAERAGLELGEKQADDEWDTIHGGGLRSTGILGQLTGDGFGLILVDDAHKNRAEAESPTMREKIWESFQDDISSREEPARGDFPGTSIIVFGARWHREDLPGRLIDQGWEHINLQAIDDVTGAPLCPELWPLEKLQKIKAGRTDYSWRSLYQGDPMARGGTLFGPATYCTRRDIPRNGIRVSVGLDLAYSGKTHSHYSVQVVLVREGAGPIYVADVLRVQEQASDFAEVAKKRRGAWPGARARWYTSTTEKGTADLLTKAGLQVEAVLATADKFVRAQPVAAAWQHGQILVPRELPWAHDFVEEVSRFTGLGDKHDDQVDALAAAYDHLVGTGDLRGFVAATNAR